MEGAWWAMVAAREREACRLLPQATDGGVVKGNVASTSSAELYRVSSNPVE